MKKLKANQLNIGDKVRFTYSGDHQTTDGVVVLRDDNSLCIRTKRYITGIEGRTYQLLPPDTIIGEMTQISGIVSEIMFEAPTGPTSRVAEITMSDGQTYRVSLSENEALFFVDVYDMQVPITVMVDVIQ